eukprot:TRINITY_DN10366_c0_g1_i1.p1 TRINITY_DN10366_c0_g1~~TRINITY_DN10366_c0_g1_i1.p1  ORF type:complete len:243 (+),score=34.49 TRINITY_DN10366_c0_g1_i1:65-793(+)
MRRRGKAGIGALADRRAARDRFNEQAAVIQQVDTERVQREIAIFKEQLTAFALKHKGNIDRDAVLRQQFSDMCLKIGVDPLTSAKGFWSEMLGVGDFYFSLGVQVTEICINTRSINGGLLDLDSLLNLLRNHRGPQAPAISQNDIIRTIDHLKVLGGGYEWFKIGERVIVQSLPLEMSPDHNSLLLLGQELDGFVTLELIQEHLKWDAVRVDRALRSLVQESLVWIDEYEGKTLYWFPQNVF